MDSDLRERILSIMDQKHHWAWPNFTRPGLTKAQLTVHFRHEFRRTSGIFRSSWPACSVKPAARDPRRPGPQHRRRGDRALFLRRVAPRALLADDGRLGMARTDVTEGPLEPEALAIGRYSTAIAVVALVRGRRSYNLRRGECARKARIRRDARRAEPIDQVIARHPWSAFYGCPPEAMRLTRAHQEVEGDHRRDAWDTVLDTSRRRDWGRRRRSGRRRAPSWLAYRDGVARAMGLTHVPPST